MGAKKNIGALQITRGYFWGKDMRIAKYRYLAKLACLATMGLLLLPARAFAVNNAATNGGALREVIVTAQRVREPEQRTPVSVVTYSSDKISRLGIINMQTLAAVDPSLQFNRNGGRGALTIRGIGTSNTTEIGNPSVPVVIDDFTMNQPVALDTAMFDIGQITVLRGPQGTLFGRSATGGIVIVQTNHPTDRFQLQGSEEFGNYNSNDTEGMINIPVSPTFQMRFAISRRYHSGYEKNTTPLTAGVPSNPDDLNYQGGRAEFAWEPTRKLNALVIYQVDNTDDAGPGIQAITFNYINPSNINSDIYHSMPNRGSGRAFPIIGSQWYRQRNQVGKLHLSYALPDGMHIAYYGGVDELQQNELDSGDPQWPPAFDSPAALGPYTINEFNYHPNVVTYNDELRLTSSQRGPLVWQAGLYYWYERNHLFAQNVANPGSVIATNNLLFNYQVRTKSRAAYGQASYQLNAMNQVSAGVRYSEDNLREFGDFTPGPLPGHTFVSDNHTSSNKVTWHVGYRFTPTKLNMLYATVNTGYKPGGFTGCGSFEHHYKPETVIAYEMGSKNRLLNDHLQMNADVFYEDYTNQQVSQWSRGCLTGTITTNAGSSHIYGLEGSMIAAINPDNQIDMHLSYLHAQYVQYGTPPELGNAALQDCPVESVYGPGQVLIGQQCNLAGYNMPFAPRVVLTAGYVHHWRLSQVSTLTFRCDGRYSTKVYLTPFNFQDETQPSYFTGDLFLNYTRAHWQVGLFARNFTNTTVLDYAAENSGGSDYLYSYDAPRTYGIQIKAELSGSAGF